LFRKAVGLVPGAASTSANLIKQKRADEREFTGAIDQGVLLGLPG